MPVEALQNVDTLSADQKYERVLNDVKEVTDATQDAHDKMVVDKEMDGALMGLLRGDPKKLQTLKDAVKEINTHKEKELGGESLAKLKTFLEDVDNVKGMKKDFDEFMKKIDNPQKLSSMTDKEIRRVCLYLQANEVDAIKAYDKIKSNKTKEGLDDKDNGYIKSVWDALKDIYKNNDNFIKEDFNDLYDNITDFAGVLKGYAGDGWNGEDSGFTGDLNGKFKENDTIVSKDALIDRLKDLNEERIKSFKNEAISKCGEFFDTVKDKYEKSGDGIKIKNDENETIYYAASIKLTYGDKLKECIKDAGGKQILSDEESRLLNSWNDELFDLLLSKLEEVDEGQAAPVAPEAPAGGVKEIPMDKWEMTDPDFNAMKENLGKDMFITYNEGTKTYSYNSELLTKYLQQSQDDSTENNFKLNASNGAGMVWKRRAWISAVQLFLNKNHESNLKVDGKLGWDKNAKKPVGETYIAVKKFQTEYNEAHPDANPKLVEDGIPGPSTIKALLEPATTTQQEVTEDGQS